MLARRFTIVCLLITLFGMGLSSLVAQAGRTHDLGRATACMFDGSYTCQPASSR